MIQLELLPKGLRLIPLDLEALADARDIYDALERQTCNGWEWVRPEECGALTDGDILTEDCTRDDRGKLTQLGRVYWDSEYQVQDTLEELRAGRPVVLSAHD